MALRPLMVLCFVLACSAYAADSNPSTPSPPPSAVLSPGQSFTITGHFTAKARAEPLLFDDFESASVGSNISGRTPPVRNGSFASYTWVSDTCGDNPGSATYESSDAARNSTRHASFGFTSSSSWCNQAVLNAISFAKQGDQLYLSFRQKTAKANSIWPRQSKSWILYDTDWADHLYFSTAYDNCEAGGWRQHVTAGPQDAGLSRSGREPPANAWVRLENWVVNSASGSNNGRWWSFMINEDGRNVTSLQRNSVNTRSGSSSSWTRLTLGGAYYDPCSGTYPTADILVDDVYLDDTPQRVEICNSPQWAQCTRRAVQVAKSWRRSSITATFRKGMLQSGDAYVYVIGPDGNPEFTQQVTIQ
jgi:hypothetical protein